MNTLPQPDQEVRATTDRPWRVVVWNDPVNLMTYVTYVFETHFGYPHDRAHALMLKVHTEGRAVVNEGGREQMERDVVAMHAYGLWATLEHVEG
ncbi:MAG: ATP-dependent Clp protease adapter ClpS [Actinomycetales bacterium]|nr:ATP-dependent Clp protease adapter ClpS [Actinomycetales bacterium]